MKNLIFFTLIFIISLSKAQESELILKEIMSGNEFIGEQPYNIQWSSDSRKIIFQWNKDNETIVPYYLYDLKTKKHHKIPFNEINKFQTQGFYSDEKQEHIYIKNDGFTKRWKGKDVQTTVFHQTAYYSIQRIEENGLLIKSNNNLFYFDIEDNGVYQQVTNFSKGSKREDNESESYLKKQQSELFEIVREEEKRSEDYKKHKGNRAANFPKPFYLHDWRQGMTELSGNHELLIFTLNFYPENENTEFSSYVNDNGYTESHKTRPKVGAQNPSHELYYWNLKADTSFKINLDQLTGVYKKPEYLRTYNNTEDYVDQSEEIKDVIYHIHGFNKAGSKCIIEIKSYDNKDRWIGYYDVLKAQFIETDHQHDEAWIGGPGISSWNMVPGNIDWINNELFFYQSEVTGYSHLYTFNTIKNESKTLTSGNWEVHEAYLSQDKNEFYISANKNHPGNREFYSLNLKSKELIPILTAEGNFECTVSPDEKWIAVRYSYKNKPWELYIAPLKENSNLEKITNSTTEKFNAYSWRDPKVITYKAEDGINVNARLYEPKEKNKNKAAVIFVHGAGYLQNAHNWWSGYYREYMFNNLLTDLGYTVLDIDYRASKGYGRDFRTGIYRFMGGKDLSDQLDGRDYLINELGIDEDRIGMYGGSYGGFITLMALLTEPGKFKCGAALRSVTDWAHYNHEYTSNILNTPEEDPEAYRKSSPIYYAENLQDRLIMLHGMEDGNVQYQDVVRLSQRFIELGKTGWDLVGFPIEGHGFQETTSWTEEYRRILEMFETELK